ncbi:Hypothetical predicted protein [Xyrichtys novacula]|uniref:Uncharacterized protein n=1 Tax=Xyrichtys novacula TaxID=13765 RepID=A0AAV1GV69_XYRNO|nr:Hypothetical predicted protein [Xyrichtys novacula]
MHDKEAHVSGARARALFRTLSPKQQKVPLKPLRGHRARCCPLMQRGAVRHSVQQSRTTQPEDTGVTFCSSITERDRVATLKCRLKQSENDLQLNQRYDSLLFHCYLRKFDPKSPETVKLNRAVVEYICEDQLPTTHW